jgi:DNA-binding MarR family transcriptional regulator
MSQVAQTTDQATNRLQSWVSFLRAHSAITRQLNADLLNVHGLTLNDYEVLLMLNHAEGGRMRRVDLAQTVVLTASGITRLLDGLERAGYVEKDACPTDLRVSYAKLTTSGRIKLKEAAVTHLSGVDELFVGRFSDPELESLAELLGRLPLSGKDCTAKDCTVDSSACG